MRTSAGNASSSGARGSRPVRGAAEAESADADRLVAKKSASAGNSSESASVLGTEPRPVGGSRRPRDQTNTRSTMAEEKQPVHTRTHVRSPRQAGSGHTSFAEVKLACGMRKMQRMHTPRARNQSRNGISARRSFGYSSNFSRYHRWLEIARGPTLAAVYSANANAGRDHVRTANPVHSIISPR